MTIHYCHHRRVVWYGYYVTDGYINTKRFKAVQDKKLTGVNEHKLKKITFTIENLLGGRGEKKNFFFHTYYFSWWQLIVERKHWKFLNSYSKSISISFRFNPENIISEGCHQCCWAKGIKYECCFDWRLIRKK